MAPRGLGASPSRGTTKRPARAGDRAGRDRLTSPTARRGRWRRRPPSPRPPLRVSGEREGEAIDGIQMREQTDVRRRRYRSLLVIRGRVWKCYRHERYLRRKCAPEECTPRACRTRRPLTADVVGDGRLTRPTRDSAVVQRCFMKRHAVPSACPDETRGPLSSAGTRNGVRALLPRSHDERDELGEGRPAGVRPNA